jgi:mannose-6-phosphate isomerase-like protein (cupin superfamily)
MDSRIVIKRMSDHNVVDSNICGVIREVLIGNDYNLLNLAISIDIGITQAHFHEKFDEIYFVLDGKIKLLLHEPEDQRTWTQDLGENELCVIPAMVHHKIIEASQKNRVCFITIPQFNEKDQHISEVI